MKKYYQLACMLFCWLAYAAGANAQSPNLVSEEKTVSDVEERTVYAFVMGNPDNDYGYGVATFKTDAPQDITMLHEWGNGISIWAGAAAYGEYYGYLYQFDSVGGAFPISLSKINLRTGKVEEVKDWSDMLVKFQDMTFDYSTNTMYGVGFDFGDTHIYTIDLQTGDITTGPMLKTNGGNQTISTLAATYDGRLYGTNTQGVIYQIDKETGSLTRVMETGVSTGYNQSMEFDHTDDCLYWATYPGRPNTINELYKIDINKKTLKSLGELGKGGDEVFPLRTQACGLYIPFVEAGFDAPGQVTDLKAIPAEKGALEAVITWKNPVKTHGGDAFSGTVNLILERDGEIISSSLGEAGAEMSWTDKSVKFGEHIYTVKPINEKGEGARTDADAYVGDDIPAPTTDLMVTVGSECKSIKLDWTIPEKGLHNGYYDKSDVKFKIIRYPDGAVLEEDYQGDSYEDKSIKRLGAYYYGVTATNKAGASEEYVRRSVIIAGKTIDLPYDCGFEDETVVQNQWSVMDANRDGNTWRINSGWGGMIFGDFASTGVEYVLDMTLGASPRDADDWLISPPLYFEAGKKYYISFDIRSAGIDELNITFGNLNNPDSQNQIIKSGFFTEEADEDDPQFKNYKFQLPEAEGVHCVGFNLVTRVGESYMYQMTNLMIDEGEIETGIESVAVGEETKICMDGDRLTVEGNFKTADIYNTTGVCVATLNEANAEITTAGWHPGIYIVKVANVDAVYTHKIVIK